MSSVTPPVSVERDWKQRLRDRESRKSGIFELIRENGPYDYTGTLNPCLARLRDDDGQRIMRAFDAVLSRRVLGRDWQSMPSSRPFWIAIPERRPSLHYHFILRVPLKRQLRDKTAGELACDIEARLRKREEVFSNVDLQLRETRGGFETVAGYVGYMLKEDPEPMISTQFQTVPHGRAPEPKSVLTSKRLLESRSPRLAAPTTIRAEKNE